MEVRPHSSVPYQPAPAGVQRQSRSTNIVDMTLGMPNAPRAQSALVVGEITPVAMPCVGDDGAGSTSPLHSSTSTKEVTEKKAGEATRSPSCSSTGKGSIQTEAFHNTIHSGNRGLKRNGQQQETQRTVPGDTGQRRGDHWSVLADTVWKRTKDDINRWWNEINSLLTFAGLFSAVVTGFGVLCYTVLADPNAPPGAPVLHPYIAALWFASLVCGLTAASIAISVNQWLNYLLTPAGLVEFGPRQKLRIWNLRQATFKRWHVGFMIGIPPVLLQLGLTLFLIGLVGFLWALSIAVAMPSLVLVAVGLLFQLATLVIPAVVVYSPFQSPQAQCGRWIWVNSIYMLALAAHGVFSSWLGHKPSSKQISNVASSDEESQPEKRKSRVWSSSGSMKGDVDQGSPLSIQKDPDEMPKRTKMEFLEQSIFYFGELCKHCTWVMNEKLYLDDKSHTEFIDSTLFAATFAAAVTKDDEPTLGYIRACLYDMPVDLACTNASALLIECDNARLDNDIHSEFEDGSSSWQYDSLDTHVTIMMAEIIVDVTERLIGWDHPEHIPPRDVEGKLVDMIDQLDGLLLLLPREAEHVYHRLLHLLRDTSSVRSIEKVARKHILAAAWKHVACFDFKDAEYIKEVLKSTHGKEDDYNMRLEMIMLALHIDAIGQTSADGMLNLLIDFLQSSSKDQFTRAINAEGSHVLILFCDLELYAHASTQGGTDTELLSAVVRRLLWLAGDREFASLDQDAKQMTSSSLNTILVQVNKRLPESLQSKSWEPIECMREEKQVHTSRNPPSAAPVPAKRKARPLNMIGAIGERLPTMRHTGHGRTGHTPVVDEERALSAEPESWHALNVDPHMRATADVPDQYAKT